MKSRLLIDRLISSIENSDINQIDRLKIIKVLLVIKIKLIEFSNSGFKLANNGPIKKTNGRPRLDSSKKYNLVLQFIRNKGGRVNSADLLSLGLAGRSLRRYIKNLCRENKVKIEKSGRNYFYLVV